QERVALGGAREGQVGGDVKPAAVETGRVQLGRICPRAGRLVADERGVLPRVPQRQDDRDELVGALVALLAGRVRELAEVGRRRWFDGGDDVPARPAVAD